ncbi:c-type cytochrome [Fundidesulfovibrio putealis]|uniref:c-type cytochrome n=1 Tax=Fundidesulfovibrio putealis TaxID=270496 RepID=UPI00146FC415|nr:cytochrome c [Fundidesulfovibrio putealis]
MKAVSCLMVVLGSSAAMALLFVWSGFFNISAREPHWSATTLLIGVVRDRSIAVHSNNIMLDQVDNSKYLSAGLEHFHDMCRLCHGAPGYPQSEFAKGLYPSPPELASKTVQSRSDVEIYWIVDNGLKMTGMPAFGSTHDKDAILGMMAVLRKLPSLSANEYLSMLDAAGLVKKTQNNSHGATNDESHSPLIDQKGHHH